MFQLLRQLLLYYHTLKHLKLKQVFFRLVYFIGPVGFFNYPKLDVNWHPQLHWDNSFPNPQSYLGNHTFIFLNQKHCFNSLIDWNFKGNGKLWTYNLNYFDFLNQDGINVNEAFKIIQDYVEHESSLQDGKESYTISLRAINWIKFLSGNKIEDKHTNQVLYQHCYLLYQRPEYHLLGNHLLENGFALFFAGYYFQNQHFIAKGVKIIRAELNEQILKDGGHYERSPMYHKILLFRLLDIIHLIQNNNWTGVDELEFL